MQKEIHNALLQVPKSPDLPTHDPIPRASSPRIWARESLGSLSLQHYFTTAPDANETCDIEGGESSRDPSPSHNEQQQQQQQPNLPARASTGARPKVPPRPNNLTKPPPAINITPVSQDAVVASPQVCSCKFIMQRLSEFKFQVPRTPSSSRILPAAALKDRPTGSYLITRRSKVSLTT